MIIRNQYDVKEHSHRQTISLIIKIMYNNNESRKESTSLCSPKANSIVMVFMYKVLTIKSCPPSYINKNSMRDLLEDSFSSHSYCTSSLGKSSSKDFKGDSFSWYSYVRLFISSWVSRSALRYLVLSFVVSSRVQLVTPRIFLKQQGIILTRVSNFIQE